MKTEYCPALANTRQMWLTFLKYGKVYAKTCDYFISYTCKLDEFVNVQKLTLQSSHRLKSHPGALGI